MPIYTKTGDAGTTSLFGGKRVLKCEELVDVYGSIDELNSWIGYIRSKIKHQTSKIQIKDQKDEIFNKIQSDLFVIGGKLAGWETDVSVLETRVTEMEVEIDAMETQLPKLTNFILPGGNELAATVHLARSVCRRVERQTVAFAQKQSVDPLILKYLNRLSDLCFVYARFINKSDVGEEIEWRGRKNSKS